MSNQRQTSASSPLLSWLLDLHNRTVLTRWGDWVFATYGPVMAFSFCAGFLGAAWYAAMAGTDPVYMMRLCLLVVVPAVLIGCRLASMMLDWRELFVSPLRTIVKPGFMLQGGIFGGAVALLLLSAFTDLPLWVVLDAAAFAMPLGEGLGRIGCWVYGCCWGRKTRSPLGIAYLGKESKVLRVHPELRGVPLHPAALYAMVVYLGLFTIFVALLPVAFVGLYTALYLLIHPVARFLLEKFREDDRGRALGGLTHTNIYSLVMFAGGVLVSLLHLRGGTSGLPLDLEVGFLEIALTPGVLLWALLIGLAGFLAFGVHYGQVGTWYGSHDKNK
jgi:prolipoprotein diacylglyceryltransferase